MLLLFDELAEIFQIVARVGFFFGGIGGDFLFAEVGLGREFEAVFGLFCTTLLAAFAGGAAAAWGSPYEETPLWKWHYDLDLIRNLRDVVHDMGLEDYNDTGTYRD